MEIKVGDYFYHKNYKEVYIVARVGIEENDTRKMKHSLICLKNGNRWTFDSRENIKEIFSDNFEQFTKIHSVEISAQI